MTFNNVFGFTMNISYGVVCKVKGLRVMPVFGVRYKYAISQTNDGMDTVSLEILTTFNLY